ncbi:T9SS type B sorting domain-containing protein [Spongiimicrobium salis]|uniref:T9SS type B sorting domain-containing protein n=1 Tax=Spongiimicrobium salis TaxID=1667022 RepID=UPI00374DB4E3
MRLNHIRRITILCLLCFIMGIASMMAQTLNKPGPSSTSPFTAACSGINGFNEYYINFTWSPPLVNNDNEFILELSDANGDFGSAVELVRDNTKNVNFDFDFQFAVPAGTRGENFRLRVRSTSPAMTSPPSDPYPMYDIDFSSPILISQDANGTIPSGGTIQVCDGNSITLGPHNIPNSNTYQYNWYRSGTLLAEKGEFLTINGNPSDAGMYVVEIDYGSCSGSASLSNTIEITTGTSLGLSINPPAETALCAGVTQDLEANITGQGLTYTWFKDGIAITTPTVDDSTYTVNASIAGFEGDYQVEISGTGTCIERSAAITITNAGDFTVTRDNPDSLVLLPTQTETLSVTTSVSPVTYQWYRDGSPIGGATSRTLSISSPGVYFAEVTLSGGTCASTAINSENTTVVAPDSFELLIDYAASYAACENTNVILEVTTVNAVGSDGTRTDVTTDLRDEFTYAWQRNGTNINGATTRSLSLTDITENGDYTLTGVLTSFNISSNTLPVQLLTSETLTISSTSLLSCNSTDPITVSTTTDLSTASFSWLRDGVDLNDASTELSVTQPGTYQLVVSRNGCPLPSNEVVISGLDPSLISLDTPSTDIVIPEGTTRNVTASGGTAYRWLDLNNTLLSDTATVNLAEEGSYMLIASIDNCEVSIPITVSFQDTFRVPNVITVNGDGINDQWVIPNTYSNDPEINVTIFNDRGEEILNVNDYQNNWPESTTNFRQQNLVFFYKIRNANEILKQGTITVIR